MVRRNSGVGVRETAVKFILSQIVRKAVCEGQMGGTGCTGTVPSTKV